MGLSFTLDEPVESTISDEKIPDDTLVTCSLLNTTVKQKKYRDEPAPIDRLIWKFRVDEGPFFDRYVWGETGVKLTNHPNCKLLTWARAVLGIDMPAGYTFEEEDLWGRQCRVMVGLRDGTNKDGEPAQYNFVDEVFPIADTTVTVGAPASADEEEPF